MEVEQGNDVEMDDMVEDSSTEEMDEGDRLAQKIKCDDDEVEISMKRFWYLRAVESVIRGRGRRFRKQKLKCQGNMRR